MPRNTSRHLEGNDESAEGVSAFLFVVYLASDAMEAQAEAAPDMGMATVWRRKKHAKAMRRGPATLEGVRSWSSASRRKRAPTGSPTSGHLPARQHDILLGAVVLDDPKVGDVPVPRPHNLGSRGPASHSHLCSDPERPLPAAPSAP